MSLDRQSTDDRILNNGSCLRLAVFPDTDREDFEPENRPLFEGRPDIRVLRLIHLQPRSSDARQDIVELPSNIPTSLAELLQLNPIIQFSPRANRRQCRWRDYAWDSRTHQEKPFRKSPTPHGLYNEMQKYTSDIGSPYSRQLDTRHRHPVDVVDFVFNRKMKEHFEPKNVYWDFDGPSPRVTRSAASIPVEEAFAWSSMRCEVMAFPGTFLMLYGFTKYDDDSQDSVRLFICEFLQRGHVKSRSMTLTMQQVGT